MTDEELIAALRSALLDIFWLCGRDVRGAEKKIEAIASAAWYLGKSE